MISVFNRNNKIKNIPKAEDFRKMLKSIFEDAEKKGKDHVIIESGELHRKVGRYPGKNHRMPVCCGVMRKEMKSQDKIRFAPPKGNGATLQIEYKLPR